MRTSPRSSLAATISVLVHAAGLALLWSLHAGTTGARVFDTEPPATERRWNRIAGDAQPGSRPSRITEVLQAPDAVRVMLAPVSPQGSGRGLAWWSASRGIWIAVADLPPLSRDNAYQLWLVRGDGPPIHVGWLGVNERGAGRLLALTRDGDPPLTGPVMLVIAEEAGAPSSRLTADWVLAGRGVPGRVQ